MDSKREEVEQCYGFIWYLSILYSSTMFFLNNSKHPNYSTYIQTKLILKSTNKLLDSLKRSPSKGVSKFPLGCLLETSTYTRMTYKIVWRDISIHAERSLYICRSEESEERWLSHRWWKQWSIMVFITTLILTNTSKTGGESRRREKIWGQGHRWWSSNYYEKKYWISGIYGLVSSCPIHVLSLKAPLVVYCMQLTCRGLLKAQNILQYSANSIFLIHLNN